MKSGDVITVKDNKKNDTYWTNLLKISDQQRGEIPGWLQVDRKDYKITVIQVPSMDMIQSPINMTLIVEFYSR